MLIYEKQGVVCVDGLVLGRGMRCLTELTKHGAEIFWLVRERVFKLRNRACKANTQIRVVKFRL